jgi:transposase, IS5 family
MLIASASIRHDDEARWAGHRRGKRLHGYKVHVAIDQDAGLNRGVEVITANGDPRMPATVRETLLSRKY